MTCLAKKADLPSVELILRRSDRAGQGGVFGGKMITGCFFNREVEKADLPMFRVGNRGVALVPGRLWVSWLRSIALAHMLCLIKMACLLSVPLTFREDCGGGARKGGEMFGEKTLMMGCVFTLEVKQEGLPCPEYDTAV